MLPRISISLVTLLAISQHNVDLLAAEFSANSPVDALQVAEALQRLVANNDFPELDSDASLRDAARQAYFWAWPMVYVRNCHASLSWLKSSGISGGAPVAPPNRLCMLTDRVKSNMTAVACPNPDVIYGFGILDLRDAPVILQVPDFGERFWLFQLGDQRTDGFAQMGKMYGTKPGFYLIAGPDWNGVAPPEVTGVLRCPTKFGYVLPRVLLSDQKSEGDSLEKTLGQIQVYPLEKFRGRLESCDWSRKRWLPRLTAGGKSRGRVVPATFFEVLPEVLETVPPLPGEESLYAYFRELLRQAESDERVRQLLADVAAEAEQELIEPLFEFRKFGQPTKHYWSTTYNGARFGTDYFTRTAVAKSNIFVNQPTETKYFYQDLDSEGQRLSGDHGYRLTFPAGQLPPTKGHWSLTLYNENHVLYPNAWDRHSIGVSQPQLQTEPDGSVTILVQHSPPPSVEQQDNWLPAPQGKFSLYLRVYWPDDAVLSGEWSPPEVVSLAQRSAAGVESQAAAGPIAPFLPPGGTDFLLRLSGN